jgi:hypothetical protein
VDITEQLDDATSWLEPGLRRALPESFFKLFRDKRCSFGVLALFS